MKRLTSRSTDLRLFEGSRMSHCPSCYSSDISRIGALPEVYRFLNIHYAHPVNKGSLYLCLNCYLYFRNPCLSINTLTGLYTNYSEENTWGELQNSRVDFESVVQVISSRAKNRSKILDVGCYRGALLRRIRESCEGGSDCSFFGIEPSVSAASVAKSHDITIVGKSLFDNDVQKSGKYDVILMTDVFEHFNNSSHTFDILSKILNPRGLVVVTTGAYDSFPSEICRHLYYYRALPEHISFMSRKHALWIGDKFGYTVLYQLIRNTNSTMGFTKSFLLSTLFVTLKVFPSTFFPQRSGIGSRLLNWRGIGVQNLFDSPDHALAVFKKKH